MKNVYVRVDGLADLLACKTLIECTADTLGVTWHLYSEDLFGDISLSKPLYHYAYERGLDIACTTEEEALRSGWPIVRFLGGRGENELDFDIRYIKTCRLHSGVSMKRRVGPPLLVVGNLGTISEGEFLTDLMRRFGALHYEVVIVPRYPESNTTLEVMCQSFGNVTVVNETGVLEGLYAQADLSIMGRMLREDFSGELSEDHNPMEATESSNAICGKLSKVPHDYDWLYKESGLLTVCTSTQDVFDGIDDLIQDSGLECKLASRHKRILENRGRLKKQMDGILRNI